MTVSSTPHPDVIVIGAGAVGASTALHLLEAGAKVTVVEKESVAAAHQSGRNSGVIHAGYNLKPGSLKARFCVAGSRLLRTFCRERNVPMVQGGILVVARTEAEASVVAELHRRAAANGVESTVVSADDIKRIEPQAEGLQALHAPEGASFDAAAYVHTLMADVRAAGGKVVFGTRVNTINDTASAASASVRTSGGTLEAGMVVNCGGLQADRLAGSIAGDVRVIPFRGYYAELRTEHRAMVRSHVYATPDLNFPFLGVHLSRRTDGRVLVGPGAMLAFGREAYRFSHIQPRDLASTLTWPGFYRMLAKPGFGRLIRTEVAKSLSLSPIWKEARALIPGLKRGSLVRSFAGVRAQLVARDGSLVDDITVRHTPRGIHVLNAVSPGLTCSLPFGKYLAERCLEQLGGAPTSPFAPAVAES